MNVNLWHNTNSLRSFDSYLRKILEEVEKKRSSYVCMANVHMMIEAKRDPLFAEVLNQADIVAPDGVPLTWALHILHGIKQERVAGMDLLPALLTEAESQNIPVFFYGGTSEMLDQTEIYLDASFPRLRIAGMYSPPFRKLTIVEEEEVIDIINDSGTRLVFVALGCPKQEKWMASMKGRIQSVMIGIGGALPVLVGMQKRAPLWMQKVGMEWTYRLLQEPRRLFKRYAVTNTLFVAMLVKEIIRVRLLKRKLSTT